LFTTLKKIGATEQELKSFESLDIETMLFDGASMEDVENTILNAFSGIDWANNQKAVEEI
jgi:hypothetical protein